jgi:hypothetical protein
MANWMGWKKENQTGLMKASWKPNRWDLKTGYQKENLIRYLTGWMTGC